MTPQIRAEVLESDMEFQTVMRNGPSASTMDNSIAVDSSSARSVEDALSAPTEPGVDLEESTDFVNPSGRWRLPPPPPPASFLRRDSRAPGIQGAPPSVAPHIVSDQIKANHGELTELENRMREVCSLIDARTQQTMSDAERAEIQSVQSSIRDQYNLLIRERVFLAEVLGDNPIETLARPTELESGTFLYSAHSPEMIAKVLRDGIRIDLARNNIDSPKLGSGLYVDTTGATNRQDGEHVLVLEVATAVDGISTKPLEDLRAEGAYTDSEIAEGYSHLQQHYAFLQSAGLAPEGTTIVLRSPKGSVRVVGVMESSASDQVTPVPQWLRKHGVQLHNCWKSIQIVERYPDYLVLQVDGEGAAFFKPAQAGDADHVRCCEVGASKLAAHLAFPNLVPQAELMTLEGRAGIKQPFVEHTILSGLEPTSLTQKQVNQMFAHMLTDYVISNYATGSEQFGIDTRGNLVAFDKARAFEYFVGERVASPMAIRGVGPELNANGSLRFFELNDESPTSVYPKFRAAVESGRIAIEFADAIIQDTIAHCATLNVGDVRGYMGAYADDVFGEKAEDFCRDVVARAHRVCGQVYEYLEMLQR